METDKLMFVALLAFENHCHCEESPEGTDVAISWYNLSKCYAKTNIVPGDSHVRALPFLGMTCLVVRCNKAIN